MGTRKRRSDRALRAVTRSPAGPGVARREDRRRFWASIAAGLSSEDAAVDAGVSPVVGTRWFREAGGMPPSTLGRSSKPPSGRYLSFTDREEISLWRAHGGGVREIARRLGRAASTISRELRRNAATRGGGLEYRATTAQWHAARLPEPAGPHHRRHAHADRRVLARQTRRDRAPEPPPVLAPCHPGPARRRRLRPQRPIRSPSRASTHG